MDLSKFILVFHLLIVVDAQSWSLGNLLMSGTQGELSLVESVAIGAKIGIEECKKQFMWDKWNCPSSSLPIFSSRSSPPVTKEMAFVYAITSAGVMHTLTRNCSLGDFEKCSCDMKKRSNSKGGVARPGGWKWGGCSENANFGYKISRQFLDGREMGRDARAMINLQNNRAGRVAVKRTMKRLCKCHGVSGSCATKTCWMRLSEFSLIGKHLKRLYNKAVIVEFNEYNSQNDNDESPLEVMISRVHKKHLVFDQKSPDYCRANYTAGSHGTLGRECSREKGKHISKSQRQSCKSLCRDCGLKVKKEVRTQTSNCNCKFQWCCDVKCDTCFHKTIHYSCSK